MTKHTVTAKVNWAGVLYLAVEGNLRLSLSVSECATCKVLLREASDVMKSHLEAISEHEEAAIQDDPKKLKRLRTVVRDRNARRLAAVERYQNHSASHNVKAMAAGQSFSGDW